MVLAEVLSTLGITGVLQGAVELVVTLGFLYLAVDKFKEKTDKK